MPKVSVCIPTYNRTSYLKEAIESVLNQTFTDFELLIVDNNPDDRVSGVLKLFRDNRIKYYKNSQNIGPIKNWNRCIELASGAYITIFHDDDVMLPENLSKKTKVLDENRDVGLVHSDCYIIDVNGNVMGNNWAKDHLTDFIEKDKLYFDRLFYGDNSICAPTALLRKQCFDEVGIFDTRLYYSSDYEMWMRIALFWNIAYLKSSLLKYRRHEGGATSHYKNELFRLKECYQAKKYIINKYPKKYYKQEKLQYYLWVYCKNEMLNLLKLYLIRHNYFRCAHCIIFLIKIFFSIFVINKVVCFLTKD